MPEFQYTDLLPLGTDATEYRLLSADGISTRRALGREFLEVDPGVLTMLAREGMRDIAHLLRPGHLRQLRSILDDPQACPNDRYVARELLQNACIAAGGVLPMCQDTGTAIVLGKRGGEVLTDGRDEERLSRGIYDAYTQLNLRYSQLAPPACTPSATPAATCRPRSRSTPPRAGSTSSCSWPRGAARPTSRSCTSRPRRCSTPARCWPSWKRRSAPWAPPPARRTTWPSWSAGPAPSTRSRRPSTPRRGTWTHCPRPGSASGHGFRDRELEQQVLEITRQIGIGAQFGGKYFCHDVRVVRLPRHGASCPVAIAVSCSADRQALAKITAGRCVPGAAGDRPGPVPAGHRRRTTWPTTWSAIDLNRPMTEIRAELSQAPGGDPAVADRPDGGRARHRPREDL